MADETQSVRETTTRAGNTVQTDTEVRDPRAQSDHQQNVAERVIWFVAGVLLVLLAFRFLFSLLGANPSNPIADFVYSASQPFVSPFFSLFRYDNYTIGAARFEVYTLVAMLFYMVLAWGLAKLVTLNRE